MLSFSTDELAPKERFDQWREVRGKSLMGVTIEMPRERRPLFHGTFRASQIGPAVAAEMKASAYHLRRTKADIARVASGSLCIGLQVTGPGQLDTGDNRTVHIRNGDIAISHSDLPFDGTPLGSEDFHYKLLKIPVDDELLLGQPAYDLFGTRHGMDMLFARPFRALFDALTVEMSTVGDPSLEIAHIARLALALRGRLARGRPEVRAAIRSGLRHAAEAIMARDKHKQSLSPSRVAGELGISIRQLHVIFGNAERPFSRTLAEMRIADAKRVLLEWPALSVTQVAFACGFDNLATFYRLFTARFGMAPGELRASATLNAASPLRRLPLGKAQITGRPAALRALRS